LNDWAGRAGREAPGSYICADCLPCRTVVHRTTFWLFASSSG
jgi:hypothetical protein